jgi:hypothetical protein
VAPTPRKADVTALAELIARSQPRPTGRRSIADEDELDPPDRATTTPADDN